MYRIYIFRRIQYLLVYCIDDRYLHNANIISLKKDKATWPPPYLRFEPELPFEKYIFSKILIIILYKLYKNLYL